MAKTKRFFSSNDDLMDVTIDTKKHNDSELKQFLRELPTAKIKKLTMLNSYRWLRDSFSMCFANRSFALEAFNAIRKNHNIETLELDDLLTGYFPHRIITFAHINFHSLLACPNLKTLTINGYWFHSYGVFKSLLKYITDPRCKLETLTLKFTYPLPASEFRDLCNALENAKSLKNCKVTNKVELSPELNKILSTYDSSTILHYELDSIEQQLSKTRDEFGSIKNALAEVATQTSMATLV